MAIVAKRTVMSLYSDNNDMYSHQVRVVLAEKGVNADILSVPHGQPSDELIALNPYGTIPTLIDRDLVLYEARIIMEYLDERFPHPPLLPVYPVARAESRKMMYRIENDWYRLACAIESDGDEQAKQQLAASLLSLEPIFLDKPYFLSEEFSLLDCILAPLVWRLPKWSINIPEENKGLLAYMERVFGRDAFQSSLTDVERQMRAA